MNSKCSQYWLFKCILMNICLESETNTIYEIPTNKVLITNYVARNVIPNNLPWPHDCTWQSSLKVYAYIASMCTSDIHIIIMYICILYNMHITYHYIILQTVYILCYIIIMCVWVYYITCIIWFYVYYMCILICIIRYCIYDYHNIWLLFWCILWTSYHDHNLIGSWDIITNI